MAKSVLTDKQKKFFVVVLVITTILLANSAYLYITNPRAIDSTINENRYEVSTYGMVGLGDIKGEPIGTPRRELPQFYQAMLLSHIVGGLAIFGLVLFFVVWHLKNALKRRNKTAIVYGSTLAIAAICICVSGLFILTEANSLQNRWIFYGHRLLAVMLPVFYIAHRSVSSSPLSAMKVARGFGAVAAMWLGMLAIHHISLPGETPIKGVVVAAQQDTGSNSSSEPKNDPFIPFVPTNLGYPGSIFFPSAVTTSTGGHLDQRVLTQDDLSNPELIKANIEKYGFVVDESMGSATCARCHAGVVEQWSKSAHRFSSFNNPFYRASVEAFRDEEDGKRRSQWCGACHDPALMFQQKMLEEIDPHTPEAQAGITCLTCHGIDAIHGKVGNGNYNISDETPSPYLFEHAKSGPERLFHDMLVKSKPTVHKNMMLKPFYRTSEYCLTCHKVSLDVPINNYRWLRGQNDYDAWHDSGVALNASRTFYLPQAKRVCQDCHMPKEPAMLPDVSAKNGMVKSHRFLSVNTALPYLRGDQETIDRIEEFLQNEKMSIDVFAVHRGSDESPVVLDRSESYTVEAGEEIQVDVVVRNKGVGHTFPGGTNDSNEAWVDFQVFDESGRVYYRSGTIAENGKVDPYSQMYKVVFVNGESHAALERDPQNFRATVYVHVIGPGTADVVRYRIKVPEEADGKKLSFSAKLMWRKFNRDFTEFVFKTMKLPELDEFKGKTVPDLPVTEITSDVKSVLVSAEESNEADIPNDQWLRYNDYGIAHFIQQDFKTAEWAFLKVNEMQPEKIDGKRNLARIAVVEGRIQEAYNYLDECEKMQPGDPQTAWFWGLSKQADGLYEEAASAYQRVLAYFPEDRASWRQLGRTYYLNGQYQESLDAYFNVLAIDPEDREAHYHRMLCYRALDMAEEAAEAEKAYTKYKIDETAQEFTQKYRLNNPADNHASQMKRVYDLQPLDGKISMSE